MYKFFKRLLTYFKSLDKPSPEEIETAAIERYFNCIKSFEGGASKISAWSLAIFGGSLLAIINDSYIRPSSIDYKLIYLCFIVGWLFLAISMYNGMTITGRTIVAELYKNKLDRLQTIFEKCNADFARQLQFFKLSIITFSVWLVLYILWWIFGIN